jgi:hypothetical protein
MPLLTRVAIVCARATLEDVEFWENVAANRGLRVRFFLELDAALSWLNEIAEPSEA